jgi:hypothetical protein
VTLFPAAQPPQRGWAAVRQALQRIASLYSNSTPVTFDLLAAGISGDWKLVHRHGDPGPGGNPAVDHLRAELRNRPGEEVPT